MEIKKLKEKLMPFIKELGYELYEIELTKQNKDKILTIYIDNEKDITIDDCVIVTKELNPFIDKLDPIEGTYMLEVSSAGAEKELRNEKAIKNSVGKYVYLETYEQKISGYLKGFDGNEIKLKVRNKEIYINYEEVNLIRLAIKF